MQLRFTLMLLVVAVSPALAQPAPKQDAGSFDKELDALFAQGGLTSDQAASRAAGASPTVRRSAAEIDAAIATALATELQLVPRVGASATYTRLSHLDPLLLTEDPNGPKFEFLDNSYAVEGSLNVALSDYLLRYPKLISAAKLGLEAARVTKKNDELGAGQDARLAYYEWVRSKLQVLVAQRQLTQVRATLGQVRALAEAQRLSRADLMRVESQEAQADQVASQLKQLSDLREEQLRLLIGAPSGEPLVVGEDIRKDVTAPAAGPLDQLMGTATKQRLEFRALDVGIQAKDKQREAETASQLPRLSGFAAVDYARPNQRVFPQVDEFRLTWQAGVQLSWTFNDALIANANKQRFAAEARELRADRENLERGTRIAVLAAQQAVTLAQQALVTSQKGLAAAEESYRVRQALLAAQRATAVELVDAETELTRARITALNARVDLRVAMTQLSHALGNDVAAK